MKRTQTSSTTVLAEDPARASVLVTLYEHFFIPWPTNTSDQLNGEDKAKEAPKLLFYCEKTHTHKPITDWNWLLFFFFNGNLHKLWWCFLRLVAWISLFVFGFRRPGYVSRKRKKRKNMCIDRVVCGIRGHDCGDGVWSVGMNKMRSLISCSLRS